jgi:hypothetical protein
VATLAARRRTFFAKFCLFYRFEEMKFEIMIN